MNRPESWPEYTERDPSERRRIYLESSDHLQAMRRVLRDRAPERFTYSGTESPRPFRRCSPMDSPRGARELWLDEEPATALRNV